MKPNNVAPVIIFCALLAQSADARDRGISRGGPKPKPAEVLLLTPLPARKADTFDQRWPTLYWTPTSDPVLDQSEFNEIDAQVFPGSTEYKWEAHRHAWPVTAVSLLFMGLLASIVLWRDLIEQRATRINSKWRDLFNLH